MWPSARVCCVTPVAARYVRQVTPGRKARWTRFAPGLGVLLSYDRAWLRGDILAGITVSAYLIPQVMAYAEAATATPPTVTDEMVEGLRRQLDDAALVELTMMIAVENVRSRFNSALGLTSQGFKDRCEIPVP